MVQVVERGAPVAPARPVAVAVSVQPVNVLVCPLVVCVMLTPLNVATPAPAVTRGWCLR